MHPRNTCGVVRGYHRSPFPERGQYFVPITKGMSQKLGLLSLLVSLLASGTGVGLAADSVFLVRKRVSEVQFMLVATDLHNRPLAHLSPADIRVLEDGRPVPNFELRSAATLPLRVEILLDLSDSNEKSWANVKNALVRSVEDLMRPKDELLVVGFSSKIEFEHTVSDPRELGEVLANPHTGGLTSLYDAIYHGCDEPLFGDQREPHRSAMILLSDGEDDLSMHGLNDAIMRAERRGISIYTVTTRNGKKSTPGEAVLRDLATNTGGRDYIAKNTEQFRDALSAINEELRSSYLLYYRVPETMGTNTFRRVDVIPTQSNGSQMRSRAGYFTAP